jgi:hypothetical protein
LIAAKRRIRELEHGGFNWSSQHIVAAIVDARSSLRSVSAIRGLPGDGCSTRARLRRGLRRSIERGQCPSGLTCYFCGAKGTRTPDPHSGRHVLISATPARTRLSRRSTSSYLRASILNCSGPEAGDTASTRTPKHGLCLRWTWAPRPHVVLALTRQRAGSPMRRTRAAPTPAMGRGGVGAGAKTQLWAQKCYRNGGRGER